MATGGFAPQVAGAQHISELRIVLMGWSRAGKSSAGNTILGRQEFEAVRRRPQCVKMKGEVAGRQVAVVDVPGWRDCTVQDTPEEEREEIVSGATFFEREPHAVLLAVPLETQITEEYRRAVEEHLELLGETVWRHTLVLFTFGGCLRGRTIEQHIEAEGKALQWLVKKCGNRYHVFDNKNRSDRAQVTELLEKIEEMVAGNSGGCFEMNHGDPEKVEDPTSPEEEKENQELNTEMVTETRPTQRTSELRMVLLGLKNGGKSSAGNIILGTEEFGLKSTWAMKRQAKAAGRKITLVDTPGWQQNAVLNASDQYKHTIPHSVSMCPPGPHAVLLVISLFTEFTETHRKSVEEHLELLSETVWRHTMVLFTGGDRLQEMRSIKQHIKIQGKPLNWVLEKCGNRYHIFNNKDKGDGFQVTELLEKVEELVARNGGSHYQMDRALSRVTDERIGLVEERAKQRLQNVREERERIRKIMGKAHVLPELRVVLLGWRKTGKSSAGNTILCQEHFVTGEYTQEYTEGRGFTAGRKITVVDTPGWFRKVSVLKTPEFYKQQIASSLSKCPPGPHAFLLVIDVTTSFIETQRTELEECFELLGDKVWRHVMVLFTKGDCLKGTTVEEVIENEGEHLRWLVEKCGNRYHALNNVNRGNGAQVRKLLEKIEEMVAENSGQYFSFNNLERMEGYEKRKSEMKGRGGEKYKMTNPEFKQLTDEIKREVAEAVKIEIKGLFAPRGLRSLSGAPPTFSGGSRHSESVTSYDELEEMIPHHLVRVFEWLNESGYKIKSSESGPASHDSDSGFIERDAFLNEIIGEKQEKRMQDLIEETATEDNNVAKNE